MIDLRSQLHCGNILSEKYDQIGPKAFGYWIQGIAAHLLLEIGASVTEIKSSGHPDVTAMLKGGNVRLEVEVDSSGYGRHLLDNADIESLRPQSALDQGFYALLRRITRPAWILVPHGNLLGIDAAMLIPIIETRKDREWSELWTAIFIKLINNNSALCKQSFNQLCRMAMNSHNFNS